MKRRPCGRAGPERPAPKARERRSREAHSVRRLAVPDRARHGPHRRLVDAARHARAVLRAAPVRRDPGIARRSRGRCSRPGSIGWSPKSMVTKVEYEERPPRYEYRLTDKGRDFWPVLAAMWRWAADWLFDDAGPPVVLKDRETGRVVRPARRRRGDRRAARSRAPPRRPPARADPTFVHFRGPGGLVFCTKVGRDVRRCAAWLTIRSRPRPCKDAEHLEPHFVFPEAEAAADAKLAARAQAAERRADRLRRRRLGRLRLLRRGSRGRRADAEHRPARPRGQAPHELLLRAVVHAVARVAHDRPAADAARPDAPADVRRGRRPAGRGHDRAAALRRRVRRPRPSASGTWARTASRSRRTSASTTSTASSPCPTCTPSGATRTSSPRSSTAKNAPSGSRTSRSTSASCTPRSGGEIEEVEEVTIPVLVAARRQVVQVLAAVHRAHGRRRAAVVPVPLHPRHALRQLPAPGLPREVAGEASVQGHDHRARRHRRPACRRRSRRPASSTTRSCSSRPTTDPRWRRGPTARTRRSARAKGSTWEGGQRVPGVVYWRGHDRAGSGDRRPLLAAWTGSRRCCGSPAHPTPMPDDRYIDGGRSDVVPARRRRASRTASSSTTGSATRSRRCGAASTR